MITKKKYAKSHTLPAELTVLPRFDVDFTGLIPSASVCGRRFVLEEKQLIKKNKGNYT